MKTFFYFICLMPALISCWNKRQDQKTIIAAGHSIDAAIGQKLVMPDTTAVYVSNSKTLLLDSNRIAGMHSFKVYFYLNVSCPSCIGTISAWKELTLELLKFNVPVILICHSTDNFEYIKYLFESHAISDFPLPLYLDLKNNFPFQNSFYYQYENEKAFLTDENNVIISKGNPFESAKSKQLFLDKILIQIK